VKPCKTSLQCGSTCGSMCAVERGKGAFTITHVWMSMSSPTMWLVHSLRFHPCVSVCMRKWKESQIYLKALQSVSMNGLSGGKLSLIVKLFGRSLFLRHLMLNSSTFLHHFFSFCPSECLQIGFSRQTVSCWGVNDHGRCIVSQERQDIS